MWSRSPERKEGQLNQNLQCNCFGESPTSQPYFLTLHNSVQIKKQPIRSPREQQTFNSLKNNSKKSLRKSSNDAPITSRTRDKRQDYYGNEPFTGVSQHHYEIKKSNEAELRSTFRTNRSHHHLTRQISPPVAQVIRPSLHKTSSWQTIRFPAYFYESQPLFISPPKIVTHQNIPVYPVKFNVSQIPQQSFPQKISPLSSPRELNRKQKQKKSKKQVSIHDLKEEVAINFQEVNKELYPRMNQDIIDFELTQDNADTPRVMPIQKKKLTEFPSIPSKESFLLPPLQVVNMKDLLASRVQKPKSNTKRQTLKSRIDTKKSCLDPSKSKIMVKSLRDDRKNLKKMDDVEEIRSMVDSNQQMSQDKQSVVLGRLNQYGSMLDPSLSLTNPTTPTLSLATPSLRSKLLSMNTQCSTIGKSYLRPFQYSMDRNHFK